MADCGCSGKAGVEADGVKLGRRSFLGWAAAGLGAAIAFVLGSTGISYFISPAFKKEDGDWVDIGSAAGIEKNVPVKVDFVARKRDAWAITEKRASAWVETSDGKEFSVFDPRCTHLGCPFSWDEEKKQFLCPCHGGVFDAGGAVVSGPPPRPLDRYDCKVVNGRLMILPTPVKRTA